MDELDSVLRYKATELGDVIRASHHTRKSIEIQLGLSGGYITRVVQGERTCSEHAAMGIADVLHVPLFELFDYTDESRELWDAWMRGERLTLRGEHGRFWSKIKCGGNDECWEWQASRDKYGYGQYMEGGKPQRSHRVAFKLVFGDLPDELDVCHTCDNPPCCNPSHLFKGTAKDNIDDLVAKGRHAHAVGRFKLNPEQVIEIRRIWDETPNRRGLCIQLAKQFDVGPTTISNIGYRRTWVRL